MFDYKDNQEEFFALHIPLIFDSFYFDGTPIRALYIEDVLWWFLCDICGVIGLSSASSAALRLNVYEKMTLSLTSSHSGQRGGARKAKLLDSVHADHLDDTLQLGLRHLCQGKQARRHKGDSFFCFSFHHA